MTTYSQPIHKNDEGLFNTQSGRLIDLLNPKPEMISLEDIALSLSNYCRFGGHLTSHYSVAEHSILVWQLCPSSLKPAALLHDADEAFLGDVIKPLKNLLGKVYKELEEAWTKVIFEKYGVPLNDLIAVKEYDMKALELEHNYFRLGNMDLIKHQYDYRTELGWYERPYNQYLNLLNFHFLQRELSYKPLNLSYNETNN